MSRRRALCVVATALAATLTPPSTAVAANGTLAPAPPAAALDLPAMSTRAQPHVGVAIAVPAFHGLEPRLSITYDGGSADGWLGVGWTLSGLSAITRVGQHGGLARLDDHDTLRYDGVDLVPCPSAPGAPGCRHPPRLAGTKLDGYAAQLNGWDRIAYDPAADRWLAWSTAGVRETFMPTLRVAGQTVRWGVAEVRAPTGTTVDYDYATSTVDGPGAQAPQLRAIRYGPVTLRFVSAARIDPVLGAVGPALMATTNHLSTIDELVAGQRARAYVLRYDDAPGSPRSVLASVFQYGRDAVLADDGTVLAGRPLAPTTLGWRDPQASGLAGFGAATVRGLPGGGPPGFSSLPDGELGPWDNQPFTQVRRGWVSADIDGDGRDDLISFSTGLSATNPGGGTMTLYVGLARGDGGYVEGQQDIALPRPDAGGLYSSLKVLPADVDGDGKTDLIVAQAGEPAQLTTLRSLGDGRFAASSPDDPGWSARADTIDGDVQVIGPQYGLLSGTASAVRGHSPDRWMSADVNGDGRADVVLASRRLYHPPSGGPYQALTLCVSLSTGSGFARSPPCQETGWEWESEDPHIGLKVFMGDANGDGRADVMSAGSRFSDVCGGPFCSDDSFGFLDFGTALGQADGTLELHEDYAGRRAGHGSWRTGAQWMPGDIDGDGRTDFIEVVKSDDDDALLQSWRSTGGDGPYTAGPVTNSHLGFYVDRTCNGVLDLLGGGVKVPGAWWVGDANGDGRADIFTLSTHAGHTCRPGPTLALGAYADAIVSRRNGSFDAPVESLLTYWRPENPIGIVPGDADGNGTTDLVFTQGENCLPGDTSQTRFCYPGPDLPTGIPGLPPAPSPGDPVWRFHRLLTGASLPTGAGWRVGDFDGDGRPDAVRLAPAGHSLEILSARGSGGAVPEHFERQMVDGVGQIPLTQWRLRDVTGDGRADLVAVNATAATGTVAMLLASSGSGFTDPVTSPQLAPDSSARAWQLADVTADGRPDLIRVTDYGARDGPHGVHIDVAPAGPGGFAGAVGQDVETPAGWFARDAVNWRAVDLDADGASDLVAVSAYGGESHADTLRNDGAGTFGQPLENPLAPGGDVTRWRDADVNGDGAADLVRIDGGSAQSVTSALGTGWGSWQLRTDPLPMPSTATLPDTRSRAWVLGDMNADGATDLAQVTDDGDQLTAVPLLARPGGGWRTLDPQHLGAFPASGPWQLNDVDGDGRPDLSAVGATDGGSVLGQALSSAATDRVRTLTTSQGATTQFGYQPSTLSRSPADPDACRLPEGMVSTTLASTTTDDGRSARPDTTRYLYGCPRWDAARRQLLGWRDVLASHLAAVNRPLGVARATFEPGPGDVLRPSTMAVEDQKGHAIWRTATSYLAADATPAPDLIARQTLEVCDGGKFCTHSTTSFRYDGFGNPVAVRERESFGDHARARETRTRFSSGYARYLVGLPTEQTAWSLGRRPARLSRVRYCYDDRRTCNRPRRGLVVALIQGFGPRAVVTRFRHDRAGNVRRIVDPDRHVRTISYDAVLHELPEHTCSVGLHLCHTKAWDPVLQQLTTDTDANDASSTYTYDAYGRPKGVSQPAGSPGSRLVADVEYDDSGDPTRQAIVVRIKDGTPDGLWVRTNVDGLGRVWQTDHDTGAGTSSAGQIEYSDASDRPWRISQPYAPATERASFDTFSYDSAGRAVSDEHPDRSALTWTYTADSGRGLDVNAVEETGHRTRYSYDPWQRLRRVTQWLHGHAATTRYAWDGADRPLGAVDPVGARTTVRWDQLGRESSITDPDRGTTRFRYDPTGNLRAQVDARRITTSYHYDALDRLVAMRAGDSRAPWTRWHYDEPGHGAGAGRLTSVVDPSAAGCHRGARSDQSLQLRYDEAGQVTDQWQCVLGRAASLGVGYDDLGRETALRYPDGQVVRSHYDDGDHLTSVDGYADHLDYDSAGRLVQADVHDGTTQRWDYDGARGWLDATEVRRQGTLLFDEHDDYLPNGLISAAHSHTDRLNLSYGYDDGGELTSVGGDQRLTAAYDDAGDIKARSDVGSYAYKSGHAHGVSRAGTHRYRYDADGDVTSRDRQPIEWDARGHATWLNDGRGWLHSLYDASGDRVFVDPKAARGRGESADAVRSYGSVADRSARGGLTKYIFAGDLLIARRSGGRDGFYHLDRAASPRVLTDAKGKVRARYAYSPWGGRVRPSGPAAPTDRQFAGQQSAGSGLLALGERLYDSRIGRFLSADTIVPDPTDPVTLNRFAFVDNNPVSLVDPTGRDLPAARAFYEQLGFAQIYHFPPDGEPGFVSMQRGHWSIGIGAGGDVDGDRFGLWIYVDDVDATLRTTRRQRYADRLRGARRTMGQEPKVISPPGAIVPFQDSIRTT